MIVGILIVELEIPYCDSLKEKRKVLNRVKDRVHNKFNVSIAEIDNQDVWNYAELGVTVCSNDKKHTDRVLSSVSNFIETLHDYVVVDISTELIHI